MQLQEGTGSREAAKTQRVQLAPQAACFPSAAILTETLMRQKGFALDATSLPLGGFA
jgi:hypothetical protein